MAQIILDSNNNLIQGDFDNATLNNRTKLQTTTTNATTNVYVVPNGSSTSAGVSVANNSSLTNASKIVMATNGVTDTQIISGVNGSGTYLPLSFYTNNAQSMIIDTAGNVGVGVSNPGNKLALPNNAYVSFRNTSAAETGYIGMTTGNLMSFSDKFYTDSSGNVLVGTTSAKTYGQVQVYKASSFGYCQYSASDPGYNSGASQWVFGMNSAGAFTVYINPTQSGNYGVYLNAGATSWTANSDERLKDITGNIDNAIASVQSLRAVKFTLKADTEEEKTARVGLIAQDVEKVLPEIVDTNEQGYLGIRYSELTPLLVAAIQEQQTIINELKSRIEALESK